MTWFIAVFELNDFNFEILRQIYNPLRRKSVKAVKYYRQVLHV